MTALSAMLDELMGKNRNAAPDEKINELHWSDEDVCKHFLCGFCPAELFTNTRSDLGVCNKTHDERTRKTYEASSRCLKMGYEEDFLRFLQNCWNDVERRIRRNHQRLQLNEEKSQSKQQNMTPSNSADDEKMTVLNQRIDEMLENIEKLGSEGEVEQAQSLMKLCDQLKEEREQLQAQRGGQMIDAFAVQEKQMEVCEVCGAFLIVGDAQSRVDDHLMGKQHMGYAKIKSAIAELKEKLTKVSEKQREERKHRTAEPGPPKRSGSRDRSHRDEASRNGNRDKDRDRRSKDHRHSPERERKRSREKESSRHRSDRDRKSSRDRDRDRGRDRRSDHKSSRDRKHSRERESRSSRRSSDRDRSDRKDSKHKRSKERSRSRDRKRSKRSEDKSNERKSENTRKSSESNEKADSGAKDNIDTKEKKEITEVIEEETVEEVIEQQAEE